MHSPEEEDDQEIEKIDKVSTLKRHYDKLYWLWIAIIVFGLVVQSLRSADMSLSRENLISEFYSRKLADEMLICFQGTTERVVTLVLFFEIILRFSCDWRNFHKSPRNWVDLGLAIITAVIQIPPIHESGDAYAWLSIFQILRIYRVVLAVSLTRQLIVSQPLQLLSTYH